MKDIPADVEELLQQENSILLRIQGGNINFKDFLPFFLLLWLLYNCMMHLVFMQISNGNIILYTSKIYVCISYQVNKA
jgi:hypothetical protein